MHVLACGCTWINGSVNLFMKLQLWIEQQKSNMRQQNHLNQARKRRGDYAGASALF